jgi:hypothetical protein
MAKAPKNIAAAFRSLEAEHADLGRDEHQTTKEAAAKAEARIAEVEAGIKDICKLAYPDDPGFSAHFSRLLRNRFRSSRAAIDYAQARDRLLVRLGEISADKHRRTLEETKRLHADTRVNRDERMFEIYCREKDSSDLSASELKFEIGKRHGLKSRSASIAAVNRGSLKKPRKA